MSERKKTGLFSHKSAAQSSAKWWRKQGYKATIAKLKDGWIVYLKKR